MHPTRKRRASAQLEHPGFRRLLSSSTPSEVQSQTDVSGSVHQRELTTLGIDSQSLILRKLSVQAVLQLEAVSTYFRQLCSAESLWRCLCKRDFGLVTRGRCSTYRKLYELFFKAHAIVQFKGNDGHEVPVFCDIRLHKESDAIWFMVGSAAPPSCPLAKWKTIPASKVRHFGISREDMQEHFRGQMVPAAHAHGGRPFKHYTWKDVHQVALTVHGGRAKLQSYVIRRCLDTRISNSVEERFERLRYLRRRHQLDRFVKNISQHERCLEVLAPRFSSPSMSSNALIALDMHYTNWHQVVDSLIHQHLIFRLFLHGKLRKGVGTLEDFVLFCRSLQVWMGKRGRQVQRGNYTTRDYCMCLDLIEIDLKEKFCQGNVSLEVLMRKAKNIYARLRNVWRWQSELGSSHCRDWRPSEIVSTHSAFKMYVRLGEEVDFQRLKTHFSSQEKLVRLLDSHSWAREVLPLSELQPFYWAMGVAPPSEQPLSESSSSKSTAATSMLMNACPSASSWPCVTSGASMLERLLVGRQIYEQKERWMSSLNEVQRTVWQSVERYVSTGKQKNLVKVLALLHVRGKHQMKVYADRHSRNLLGLEGMMRRLRNEVEMDCEAEDCSSDTASSASDEPCDALFPQKHPTSIPAHWQSPKAQLPLLDMEGPSSEQLTVLSKPLRQSATKFYTTYPYPTFFV